MATIRGTPTDNVREGTEQRDVMFALAGDDILNGLDGDDLLFGQKGDDILDNGAGRDRSVGGDGADTYRLSTLEGGPDTVTGFNLKEGDSFDLSPLVQDYRPGVSELDDYVRLEPRLVGTRPLVDVDGPGGEARFEIAAVR